jgi:stringent starvation protein B
MKRRGMGVVMEEKDGEKKERLLGALDKGMVMIHLDARRPGVLVPANLREEAHLRLNLSYRFDPPDLSVGEWGIRSTLSFNNVRFTIAVPWSALFAITSYATREFWLYADDMPRELVEDAHLTEKVSLPEPEAAAPKPRRVLREVSPVADPSESNPVSVPEESPAPKARSHLRLVK